MDPLRQSYEGGHKLMLERWAIDGSGPNLYGAKTFYIDLCSCVI